MLGANSAEAQFWKKMKDKVGKTVEETILRKTDENAECTTEETVDSIYSILGNAF